MLPWHQRISTPSSRLDFRTTVVAHIMEKDKGNTSVSCFSEAYSIDPNQHNHVSKYYFGEHEMIVGEYTGGIILGRILNIFPPRYSFDDERDIFSLETYPPLSNEYNLHETYLISSI